MARLSPIPTGPQTTSRISTDELQKGVKNLRDQRNINATIKRIRRLRGQFDSIRKESERIGKSTRTKSEIFKGKAASDAKRIRETVNDGIKNVEQRTSQVRKRITAINEAVNRLSINPGTGKIPVETGKGANLNVNA